MDRLERLQVAMLLARAGGVDRALLRWVTQHHGPPASLDCARLNALVADFDMFLMQPGVKVSEFTSAMIRLRNVFARHAKISATEKVTAQMSTCVFDPKSVLGNALTQLLDAP